MAEVLTATKRGGKQAVGILFEVPSRPEDIARRHHNRFAKEAMQAALLNFHHTLFPNRFKPGTQSKYVRKPRTLKYQKRKLDKYGHNTALVFTGKTRDSMTSPFGFEVIRVGGAAAGGKKDLSGKITYRFKFRGGTGAERKGRRGAGVFPRDMVNELQTVTKEESTHIASQFLDAYWSRVEKYRGTRKRKRVS